jgi:hypothetical protein
LGLGFRSFSALEEQSKCSTQNSFSLASGFLEAASKEDLWKFIYKFICISINMALLMMTLNRLNELGGI